MITFVDLLKHLAKRPIEWVLPGDWREFSNPAKAFQIIKPLIVRVKIQTNDIEIFFMTAQLRPQPASQHVPGLKLRLPKSFCIGLFLWPPLAGDDMDDRVHVNESRLRRNRPNSFHRLNGSADELSFELKATMSNKRKHRPFVTGSPGEERDFVYGDEKSRVIRLLRQPPSKGRAIPRQAKNE